MNGVVPSWEKEREPRWDGAVVGAGIDVPIDVAARIAPLQASTVDVESAAAIEQAVLGTPDDCLFVVRRDWPRRLHDASRLSHAKRWRRKRGDLLCSLSDAKTP